MGNGGVTTRTVNTTPTVSAIATSIATVVQTYQATVTTCPNPTLTGFQMAAP